MRISNENWTVVVEKFGNPTSFVFHLAHLVIKLKYDPPEGERASLTKAKINCGGGEAVVLFRRRKEEYAKIESTGSPFWSLRA
ncbi:hypothetical protein AVEN_55071-1 [Araneus ventricosus]|uniref:Uncharacterized protein n=1 Tax=Araneus ventricosus TaxID=182803 RepID=A0A4Y2GW78_ARAVE|nr:hypothetical protein AVEN_55071-1 [Araneus ventricosus]